MIGKIIRKESKEIIRDDRFKISLFIVVSLLIVAIFVSSNQYKNTNIQYEEAKTKERANWDSQGEKTPHSAAHYGTYAFKPKYPLSLIDQGVDKYTGVSVFLEAHKRNEAEYSAAADQTGLSRFGELTPDFVLLYIFPLIIILISYNTFTKEKEGGTIALLKSQGIRNWKLTLGKWIASLLPVVVLATILFGIAGILLSNLSDYGEFSWISLFALYSVFIVYYMVFTSITLLISSLAKKSGIALVISLTVWFLGCFAAPKIASNLADLKYPYPTRQEFTENVEYEKKKGLDGHNPWSEEAKLLEKKVLKEYGVDSLHQLPFNFSAYRMQKGEEHQAEIYKKHYEILKEQFKNQKGIYQSIAVISPFLPVRFLSMSIANTNYQTHWDFADAAENYRIDTQLYLNDNHAKNSKYQDWGYKANSDTWKNLPAFEYSPPILSDVLNDNTSIIIMLLFWLGISSGALFLSTKNL
ncbi:DUF3526 domain-containing protein [Aquimarina aquimarini]|uniref:DUF3526 domain-containing protein n=1 Tax=Aquimarina aquimarini TaxID=1191734 RepID=UPI000D55DB75|nr:DUF3526 domain-containing protein [Aquimarina aquimarini]